MSWPAAASTFTATLRDFGHNARKRQAVELLVDHNERPGGNTSMSPQAARRLCSFNHRFAHARRARRGGPAPGDNLEIDNHRYLVVNVRQTIRVLCIDGRPAGDPTKASVFAPSQRAAGAERPERASADQDANRAGKRSR